MTRQGCSYGWSWEGIAPPTGEPDLANQNEFFPTKGLYYRQKYSSVSSTVWVAGLRKWMDVEVQGWRGYTCSVVVRPVVCTLKFS
jgi:hypothetical protein